MRSSAFPLYSPVYKMVLCTIWKSPRPYFSCNSDTYGLLRASHSHNPISLLELLYNFVVILYFSDYFIPIPQRFPPGSSWSVEILWVQALSWHCSFRSFHLCPKYKHIFRLWDNILRRLLPWVRWSSITHGNWRHVSRRIIFHSARRRNEAMRWHRRLTTTQQMEI